MSILICLNLNLSLTLPHSATSRRAAGLEALVFLGRKAAACRGLKTVFLGFEAAVC